jgi:DNA anti-recombination protein RmuC
MDSETRSQRVAAALEKQLQNCQDVLGDCIDHIHKNGRWGEWELRNMLGLMKMSAQLGAVIGRLEPTAKNRESRNLNPQ